MKPKRKNKSEIKIHSKVYATKNPGWGQHAMTVTDFYEDGSTLCKHPVMGAGCFQLNELELVTPERTRELAELIKAEAVAAHRRRLLFGDE